MTATKTCDLHAEITHEIIAAIEAGAEGFVMPWHGGGGLPATR